MTTTIDIPTAGGAELPPAIVLMGPTAAGKTAATERLAERLPLEIISMDSANVFRGMDIGSAKPDAAVRARIVHHLVDIVDPTDSYSAARFCDDAVRLMREIAARGRVPLLAGGTMLYYQALKQGLNDLPAADAGLRARLDAEAAAVGWPAMHARLARVDPVTAARLAPNDSQRIQRALEVCELAGRPMSELLAAAPAPDLPCRLLPFALVPSDRAELHRRIASRFEQMLEQGLVEEVAALRRRYPLSLALPSMRAVGYRQAWQYLDGEFDRAELRERGVAATRQLAKRQLTWLRSMPEVAVVDALRPDAAEALAGQVVGALRTAGVAF